MFSNPKYLAYAYTTGASILIVNDDQVFEQPVNATIIRVKNAYTSIAKVLDQYKIMNGNSGRQNKWIKWHLFQIPQKLEKMYLSEFLPR